MKIEGKLIFDCSISKSRIHGKGIVINQRISSRRKIGRLSGLVRNKYEMPKKFNPNDYIFIVELNGAKVLDSRNYKNVLCFINHSCKPNCYMRIFGNNVEVYSLRKLKKGEELTINYGETHHDGKLKCKCQSKNCRGFI